VISLEVIQHVRRVLGSVRTARLSEEPTIDIQERLALLTVVARLRDVVAIGFGEQNNEPRMVESGGANDARKGMQHEIPTKSKCAVSA